MRGQQLGSSQPHTPPPPDRWKKTGEKTPGGGGEEGRPAGGGGTEGGHVGVGRQASRKSSQNKYLEGKGTTFPDSTFCGMWSVCSLGGGKLRGKGLPAVGGRAPPGLGNSWYVQARASGETLSGRILSNWANEADGGIDWASSEVGESEVQWGLLL